ncbi:hypothetical protein [Roseovarius arcticus]|uniref:hypothetical protein n=1 Tax=Roseovarius arcticus TaxID=2547404 RepID=UPI00111001FD|nr:hypothetical protein [Roseovarius arcticus]
MPVSDQCESEFDAALEALEEATDICAEADEALLVLLDGLTETEEDCKDEAGPEPPEVTPDMDPMLVHVLEQQWEEYRDRVLECVHSSDVEDKWNDYQDLRVACEIAMEEADAMKDELEACIHTLNEGIPFA